MLVNGCVLLIDFFVVFCFIGEIELIDKDYELCVVQVIEECWCFVFFMKYYCLLLLNDMLFL